MPVPTWDCSDLVLSYEPPDTATVVSEDIWKKFDLDFPQNHSLDIHHDRTAEDGLYPENPYEKSSCSKSREIRHHDCMWAGLCISKEHNRTLPAKKDTQVMKKVPAGRSLLISRAPQTCTKNLESDGDSTRPETPQSSESETDSDDEVPHFKHDQISINEKLSEYLGEATAVPVSEVTGQLVRRTPEEKQTEERIAEHSYVVPKETDVRSTLSDHCYHLNQTAYSKKLEHLGVQTPSDSEEEIDVVTFDKSCRPATLPTNPSPADKQHLQLTVTTALKEKSPSRPRGRPPSSSPRKRTAQTEVKPAKRARHRNYQKQRAKQSRNQTPTKTPPSSAVSRCASSDDEPDTEKRSLHNNMERQRRIELRSAFEELRVLVPEVEAKEKAPKVTILREAAVYCDMLTEVGQATVAKVTELKRRQERLRARLSQLRRGFAASR